MLLCGCSFIGSFGSVALCIDEGRSSHTPHVPCKMKYCCCLPKPLGGLNILSSSPADVPAFCSCSCLPHSLLPFLHSSSGVLLSTTPNPLRPLIPLVCSYVTVCLLQQSQGAHIRDKKDRILASSLAELDDVHGSGPYLWKIIIRSVTSIVNCHSNSLYPRGELLQWVYCWERHGETIHPLSCLQGAISLPDKQQSTRREPGEKVGWCTKALMRCD